MNPLVSLITPVFNAMPYLRAYVESVLVQDWRPLECIFVDDGSTDASWACLSDALPAMERAGIRVRLLRVAHAGQAAAVNAALPLVSGEYLTWCDADDLLLPDSIAKKADYLKRFPALGMVRSDGIVLDGDSGRELARSAGEADRFTQNIFDGLFRGSTYCYAGCYMVRTDLLFACYPEKRIPFSREGQNLQLLLPPASRSDCGFLPESLHCYCRRSSGHSSRKLSYGEAAARLQNFSRLRREILPYCRCDTAHYLAVDQDIVKRERHALCRAAAAQARRERYK